MVLFSPIRIDTNSSGKLLSHSRAAWLFYSLCPLPATSPGIQGSVHLLPPPWWPSGATWGRVISFHVDHPPAFSTAVGKAANYTERCIYIYIYIYTEITFWGISAIAEVVSLLKRFGIQLLIHCHWWLSVPVSVRDGNAGVLCRTVDVESRGRLCLTFWREPVAGQAL